MWIIKFLILCLAVISYSAFSSFNTPSPLISANGNYTISWGNGQAIPLSGAYGGQAGYELYEKNLNDGSASRKIGLQKPFATSASFTNRQVGRYEYTYKQLSCGSSGCYYYEPAGNKMVVAVGSEAKIYSQPPEYPTSIGLTPYSATVDNKGYASISIPIQVPSGVNGMHPNLSLNYSSGGTAKDSSEQGSSGLLGFGWSLSGLSAISRCAVGKSLENRYVDIHNKSRGTIGMPPLLKYNNTDNLCLDGELLVLVSGSHFSNGAEYRIYKESFRKITLRHFYDVRTKTNEIKFEIRNPNGSVAIYGENESGRATKELGPNSKTYSPAYIWSLDSERDQFNNVVYYSYTNWKNFSYNSGMQRIFPVAISYPGGRISFGYQHIDTQFGGCSAHDEDITQVGPDRWRCKKHSGNQLNSITTSNRVYKIIGNGASNSSMSIHGYKPTAVQECGMELGINGILSCRSPIQFEWLTRTTKYPDSPEITGYYYNVNFLGAVVDSLGHRTEYQYDKIYGALATKQDSKFTEFPFPKPVPTGSVSLPGDSGSRTLGQQSLDDQLEVDYVVARMIRDNGVPAAKRSFRYHYYDSGVKNLRGKDFVCFWGIRIKDEQKGHVTYTENEISKKWNSSAMDMHCDPLAEHIYDGVYNESSPKPIYKKEFRYSVKEIKHGNGAATYLPLTDQITEMSYESAKLISATTKNNTHSFDAVTGLLVGISTTTRIGSEFENVGFTRRLPGQNQPFALKAQSIVSTLISTMKLGNSTSSSDWRIGYKTEKTDTFYNGDISSASDKKEKTVTYAVKPNTTLIEKETHFPGDPDHEKVITSTYNSKGLLESVTTSARNLLETRKIEFYDYIFDSGIPARTRSSYGHESSFADVDNRFNAPRKVIDANGLMQSKAFDAFGRETLVIDDHGVSTTKEYISCSSSYCESVPGKSQAISPVYYVEIKSPVIPTTRTYYDKLNRVIRTETVGFSGENIRVDVQYDEFGRVYKTSLPYVAGSTVYYEENNYDKFDRVTAIKKPNGGAVSIAYSRDISQGAWPLLKIVETETVKRSNGTAYSTLKKVNYKNAQGQLTKVIDAEGSAQAATTTYAYDAYGNAINVTVDGGGDGSTISKAVFDNANNKISVTDPNAGTVATKYNGMGEVINSTDALGSASTYQYDRLGRLTSKTSVDGTHNWYYDPASGKGKIDYETDNKGFTRRYIYSYGRLDELQTTIAIPGLVSRTFKESYQRDFYGRLVKTTYPNGYAASNRYKTDGHLEYIWSDTRNIPLLYNKKIGIFGVEEQQTFNTSKTLKYAPESGSLLSIKYANGYQDIAYEWLSNGSLERRYDYNANVKDEYSYDAHDRLEHNESFNISNGATRRKVSQTYSKLGNLTSNKSTVGSDNRTDAYKYITTTNSRPHAVSEVTINGVLTTLKYNANGAVTSYDATGVVNDKHISYNSLNQPTVINVGASSISDANHKARDEFRYAPDGQRYYRRTSFIEAGIARTEHTYYVNGYELTVFDATSSLISSSRIRIGNVQVVQNTPKSGSVTTVHNTLLVDHQGSVIGMVGIDLSRLNLAYEAFGLRRSPTLLTNISTTELANISSSLDKPINYGYTNHEMLDRTGFIHMNGRVYDPLLGRFLSPDPIVQAPSNSQSWNRYSYSFNNPIKYTDPSGYAATETTPPTIGVRCDEACQRKGQSDAFFYMVHTATSSGGIWESYGNNLYNTATREGAMLMDAAQGLALSNAYLKFAVNGGGSKTSTNNVLGALATASSSSSFWSNPGAYLPSVPQDVMDFSAGLGDTILFGFGDNLREYAGVDGGINTASDAYSYGEWAGVAATTATGVVGGLRAAGTKGAGKEFSHWIPNRMGGPRTRLNGNFVSSAKHALSDPYRYRFMPRTWKEANPPMNSLMAQWTRIPYVYKGAATGGTYGYLGTQ